MSRSKRAKILIVDDHPLIREALVGRISPQPDLEVCGEVDNVLEALQQIEQKKPDLVLIDISLKESHGVDLIKRLNALGNAPKMLVSSMYDELLYAERCLHAGANGYIEKKEAPEKVLEAIRQVLDGKTYISAELSQRLLAQQVGSPASQGDPITTLSDRELEVFCLIGEGLTTGMIAQRLHLSVHTIDTYREKLKSKLHLENAAELSRRAMQWTLENR